jgi:hypothetical protein
MVKLIHHSPLGALEIPGVLGNPEPGEPFDAPPAIAERLLEQSDLFQKAVSPYSKMHVPELEELAREREIVPDGTKKADIIAALEAADAEEASE